jgi:hypothetical protein
MFREDILRRLSRKYPPLKAALDEVPLSSLPAKDGSSIVTVAASLNALFSRLSITTLYLMHVDFAGDLGITFVCWIMFRKIFGGTFGQAGRKL